MNRKYKTLRIAFGLIVFLGFMLVLGSAGASDLGNISIGQAMFQASIGLLLFAVGLILLEGMMK